MGLLQLQQSNIVSLGWEFYLPLALIAVFIALSVPIWISMGVGVLIMLQLTEVLPLALLGEVIFEGIDAFALIAVPLFILTGDVLVRSGMSNKLLDVAKATAGGMRSGLGSSSVLGCGFFACISGSDAADAAAIGRVTISRLVKQGYPLPYACALIASGACTGILIPPSIAYIIIGLTLGISSSTLFLAAAIPGIMILLGCMVTNIVVNRVMNYEKSEQKFSFKIWLKTVNDGKWALSVPIIILAGIYSGVFTPTEAAAVAVIIIITIGLIQKTITVSDFPKILESSAKINGVIIPIIALSLPFAQTLAILHAPQSFVNIVLSLTDNPTLIILFMTGILILAGCIMETTPNIVILSPILLPLASEIGMHEIHFCIFMITALGVGFITPPLGLNLFVVSGLTGESTLAIAKKAIPFVITMLIIVLILAFVRKYP